ncbi:hypothetical protein MBBWO_11970 [Methanobrevibacter woesei]|uniref:Uncharacterized protein n=1 Tax=Methanobrevibacter woesei TaxID=190976 RepID=A0A2U1S8E7_9EURY|nr:hypothetical protein [Methanobrevibacter woesei]MCI7291125.1 hypothetical protein [Methanobrevibacter woesei]PWB86342.1 hypothetical protein MBBWO_11970 [Methanobrevibacter woesei]
MVRFNETTCVKINKEKKDLAKSKGLKLQDILDNALNDALSIEDIECNDIRVEQIDNQIEKLKKTKEKAIADCEKKINLLMKSLNEMKDREAENFDKEIHYLELEKEFILKEINGEH